MTTIAAISGHLDAALTRLPKAEPVDQSFGVIVSSLIDRATEPLRQAEDAAIAGIAGKMPVQDVVETVMAAERGFQTAIAIRDKVVSAYLELTRMQI
jgi:flagellar hook-basal body complex protein FliE